MVRDMVSFLLQKNIYFINTADTLSKTDVRKNKKLKSCTTRIRFNIVLRRHLTVVTVTTTYGARETSL